MEWNEVLSGFLQVLLEIVIVAVVPALAALAVAWLKVKQKEIESKLPSEVLNTIGIVSGILVQAAEQSELAGYLKKEGISKKDWAMAEGEKLLKEQLGLFLDLDKLGDVCWQSVLSGLDASIESEVFMKNSYRAFIAE